MFWVKQENQEDPELRRRCRKNVTFDEKQRKRGSKMTKIFRSTEK